MIRVQSLRDRSNQSPSQSRLRVLNIAEGVLTFVFPAGVLFLQAPRDALKPNVEPLPTTTTTTATTTPPAFYSQALRDTLKPNVDAKTVSKFQSLLDVSRRRRGAG